MVAHGRIFPARQRRDKGGALAEPIPLAELELRILTLPPVSRSAHLGGPVTHARRLVELWRGEVGEASEDRAILGARLRCIECGDRPVIQAQGDGYLVRCVCGHEAVGSRADLLQIMRESADHWGDDDVPLSQAFRLLGVEAVARAIARTALMSENDYPNDFVYWPLPPLSDLLPELSEAAWQAALDGELQIEAVPYEHGKIGKIPRVVPPIELARLSPDWKLSRLCRGELDEFVEARVRRAPIKPVKKNWRELPSDEAVDNAMHEIAKGYGSDAHPAFEEVWKALKKRPGLEGVKREQVREVLKKKAFSHLRGQRGYRSKT
jgi:hypothetical protein